MTNGVLPQASAILQRVWGYSQFRGVQEEIVRTVTEGGNALVLMPTGGGKSLCYQLPSLIRPGTGIVVSPLIALMKDQVDTLRQLGVRAAYLNSTLSPSASQAVEQALLTGRLDLLYIAPERLLLPRTLDLLRQAQIALFAIDEAHCVSQWGHDFRPEYQQLSLLEVHFPDVPRVALTATADDRTRADIRRVLGLNGAPEFISSFDRPNIQYRVANKEKPREQLLEFIQTEHPEDAGVVYCLSRRSVEETAHWLQERGLSVVAYHAGLTQQERSLAQERFLNEDSIIVVATVAFGMGIDKPNVRFVAHLDLPKSMEGYYQETGRAGRDGLPSTAWMVYGLQDVVNVRRMLMDSDAPEDVKRVEAGKLNALLTYCETASCRRQVLLSYFGEAYSESCGNCDVCLNPPTVRDMTQEAQMALSAAIRTGNRFGAAYLTDILLGKENDKNKRHRTLPTYGIGKDQDVKVWRSVLRQLVSLGYLTAGPYHGLTVTPLARTILRGEAQLLLREDTLLPRQTKRTRGNVQATRVVIGEDDRPLFLALRAWRAERAKALKVPPYVIFSDAALKAITELRPGDVQTLGTVSGIGERRRSQYGMEVLEVVRAGTHERQWLRGTVQAHELGLAPAEVRPDVQDVPVPEQGIAERQESEEGQGLTDAVAEALSGVRRELARETGYAAYLIFPNATLTALAERQPRTMTALEGIPGLGPKRLQAYGERILEAVTTALQATSRSPAPAEQDVQALSRSSQTARLHHRPPMFDSVANEGQTSAHADPIPSQAVRHELLPQDHDSDMQGWDAEHEVAYRAEGDDLTDEEMFAIAPRTEPKSTLQLLEAVRAVLEGDGGVLAVLEELAGQPGMMREGLDPEVARKVLVPLDEARGLVGTLVMLHKRHAQERERRGVTEQDL